MKYEKTVDYFRKKLYYIFMYDHQNIRLFCR